MRRHGRSRRRSLAPLLLAIIASTVLAYGGMESGCSPSKRPIDAALVGDELTATVERVLDGDSVVLEDGTGLRFIGIDCPEKDEPLSDVARFRNRKLVEGRRVRLVTDSEKTDRYGRLLAYVWVENGAGNEVLVNEEMLREGLATYYEVAPNNAMRDRLLAAQEEARKAHRGLWSDPYQGRAPEKLYIGSSKRFHRPGCDSVKSITKRTEFTDREKALSRGLSPCRQCKP
jgi:micrococcal nuclease